LVSVNIGRKYLETASKDETNITRIRYNWTFVKNENQNPFFLWERVRVRVLGEKHLAKRA
jgi:hypothetical protein